MNVTYWLKHYWLIILLLSAVLLITSSEALSAESLLLDVQGLLRNRIETAGSPPQITVGKEIVHASVKLPSFYEQRSFSPAWSNEKGITQQAASLIAEINKAESEGLRPNDYHIDKIKTLLQEIRQNQINKIPLVPGRLTDIDLLLTDAFLIYGSHLVSGKTNPETIDTEWHAVRKEADLSRILEAALEKNRIEDSLKDLLPQHKGYHLLKQAISHYKVIMAQGGWSSIPAGPIMQKGEAGERVVALRNRLSMTVNPVLTAKENEDLFDENVADAVRIFQARQGLDVDGVVGPATLKALNISVEERIRQIELNLERWRWLPLDLGQRHIIVNIAGFELDVVENNSSVMKMKVVVGKQFRRTPVFSGKMSYLVLSPYWHIPPSLAVKDKLPLIRKDPDYLSNHEIKVFQGWGAESLEINTDSVDWSKIGAKNFNYRLRQEPGPINALGRVKFMFPNKFNVYLHDTPSRELFEKTVRSFSSGCIRIEDPIGLAEYLLLDYPEWNRQAMLSAIDKRTEKSIQLKQKMPVHLLYWTAWIDSEGILQFRDDIYGRDALLDVALQEKPPALSSATTFSDIIQ